ncbi:hypothetical protein QR680_000929 [Steinernema hermaphroditum]|uniref:Uncharacterized protein n=1 Tax=Steinernema hermaphroditum TaxID=289476 RepID=A0AA39GWD0_9BILA|nr:hypothetical protein QR680_000929 [Steinernema hermaphroditum]
MNCRRIVMSITTPKRCNKAPISEAEYFGMKAEKAMKKPLKPVRGRKSTPGPNMKSVSQNSKVIKKDKKKDLADQPPEDPQPKAPAKSSGSGAKKRAPKKK